RARPCTPCRRRAGRRDRSSRGGHAVRACTPRSSVRGLDVISGRLLAWTCLVAILSILNYATRATSKPPRNAVYHYSLAAGGLIQYGLILGIVLLIAGAGRRRELLAWRPPSSWGRALKLV